MILWTLSTKDVSIQNVSPSTSEALDNDSEKLSTENFSNANTILEMRVQEAATGLQSAIPNQLHYYNSEEYFRDYIFDDTEYSSDSEDSSGYRTCATAEMTNVPEVKEAHRVRVRKTHRWKWPWSRPRMLYPNA